MKVQVFYTSFWLNQNNSGETGGSGGVVVVMVPTKATKLKNKTLCKSSSSLSSKLMFVICLDTFFLLFVFLSKRNLTFCFKAGFLD